MQRKKMPEMVYWGLWGINSRLVAMAFLLGCVILGISSLIAGFVDPKMFLGTGFFLAAAWYWYAIRWADSNSAWNSR